MTPYMHMHGITVRMCTHDIGMGEKHTPGPGVEGRGREQMPPTEQRETSCLRSDDVISIPRTSRWNRADQTQLFRDFIYLFEREQERERECV